MNTSLLNQMARYSALLVFLSILKSTVLNETAVCRAVYAARVGHCRPCPRREECQGYGAATKKPRRVSAVL